MHLRTGAFRAYTSEQGRLAFLVRMIALLLALPVQPPCHFALRRLAFPPARLDARVLQRCAAQRYVIAAAQHQLKHLRVKQPLHCLPVNVSYQISGPQASLERRTRLINSLKNKLKKMYNLYKNKKGLIGPLLNYHD